MDFLVINSDTEKTALPCWCMIIPFYDRMGAYELESLIMQWSVPWLEEGEANNMPEEGSSRSDRVPSFGSRVAVFFLI
jgi:hypothetical protein